MYVCFFFFFFNIIGLALANVPNAGMQTCSTFKTPLFNSVFEPRAASNYAAVCCSAGEKGKVYNKNVYNVQFGAVQVARALVSCSLTGLVIHPHPSHTPVM